ncbi:pseudaminic acid biosynthesis protein PseG [Bacteroides fragilis]|jgi:pseudaminic acid biosynthesis-associated protein pseG
MKIPNIYFRADANAQIGYGHFIRTLALADLLCNSYNCYFATVNPTEYQREEISKICPAIVLSEKNHWTEFLSLLSGNEIVVLDNYYFTSEYQKTIKDKGCFLVCIDEMHDKHYWADVIFCPDPVKSSLFSLEPYTQLYIGLEWAFLRSPFLNGDSWQGHDSLQNIVLSLGGADPCHLMNRLLDVLVQFPISINVVTGNQVVIDSRFFQNSSINIHIGISASELVYLYQNSDAAFLSASTMCLEAFAIGIPVASGYYVNNQIALYEYLCQINAIYPLGDLKQNDFEAKIISLFAGGGKLNPYVIKYSDCKSEIMNIFSSLL